MKNRILLLSFLVVSLQSIAQFNEIWIPTLEDASTYNLNVYDTLKQLRPTGNQTVTIGVNGDMWGPTLVLHKGQDVQMNVTNHLNDSTTVHWHGLHLPAVMDGGPHQVIPPGATWQPYWNVTNRAGTYWYHPHLHTMTTEQLMKGMGGFIIIQDDEEAAMNLPRTYGEDDFPIALSSRRYTAANQIVTANSAYGDYMLVNGTSSPQLTLPKQLVRLRILNVENERGYNLGFSDNRNFYIIANDGGMLNAPVQVNRVKLMVGERIEILVDLSGDVAGSTLDLKAYNTGFPLGFPGGEPGTSGTFGSLLNNSDFVALHLVVSNPTANPIVGIPSALSNEVYWTANDATVNRTLAVTGGQGPVPFVFDNLGFNMTTINKTVNLDAIEKWTVTNNQIFGHSFHIHDVEFKIVARNGSAANVGAHEQGWKDVFYLPLGESVTFVAKFSDYADAEHPFMYHCHFGLHEDAGMMGQFVVVNNVSTEEINETDITLFPNPTQEVLRIANSNVNGRIYYVTIMNELGRTVMMLPSPDLSRGIDVSHLASGIYLVQLTDKASKKIIVKKFIKE